MPLESATYINGLVVTNPAAGDQQSQGDDHLRLIKSAIKNTFPTLSGPITGTPWQFNAATGSYSTTLNDTKHRLRPQTLVSTSRGGGQVFEAGSTATTYFEAYTDAGIWGMFALPTGGGASTGYLTFDPTGNVGVSGNFTAAGAGSVVGDFAAGGSVNAIGGKLREAGNDLIPAGLIAMWSGVTAPAGWAICNGSSGTPDLRDRFVVAGGLSYTYGTTGGATSWTGSTGAISAGTPTGTLSAGGDHNHGGAAGSYTLQIADIPSHTHGITDPGHTHTFKNGNVSGTGSSYTWSNTDGNGGTTVTTASATTGISVNSEGGGGGHSHTISSSGTHTHTFTGDALPTHYHSVTVTTLPPYYALAFIMKL